MSQSLQGQTDRRHRHGQLRQARGQLRGGTTEKTPCIFTEIYDYTSKACVIVLTLFFPTYVSNIVAMQIFLRQNVIILKGFILINNQLISSANANDINTDYYIANSTLASRYHGSVA